MTTKEEKILRLKNILNNTKPVEVKLTGVDGAVTFKDGKDGIDGKDGRDGIDGKDGKDGITGARGPKGEAGRDGLNGINGVDGMHGNGVDNIDVIDDQLHITFTNGTTKNLGVIKGRKGSAGIGLSAYRQALRGGYVGTEDSFNVLLASIPEFFYSMDEPDPALGKDGDIWIKYI